MDKSTNRFSRDAFGGGEEGERKAHAALVAHEATLLPGARVRVYRGPYEGMTGVVVGHRVQTPDGLTWAIESRNLELAGDES